MPRRRVSYGAIDPAAAREVFLREALVAGELATKGAFLAHNRQLIASIAELEHKARRQDVLVDDEAIYAFYAERVPADIHSTAAFERWRERAEATAPRLLYMTREALMRHAAAGVTEEQYPETMAMAGAPLPLAYRFAPGHPLDGLTLTVPLALAEPDRCGEAVVAGPGNDPRKSGLVPEGAAQGVAQSADAG